MRLAVFLGWLLHLIASFADAPPGSIVRCKVTDNLGVSAWPCVRAAPDVAFPCDSARATGKPSDFYISVSQSLRPLLIVAYADSGGWLGSRTNPVVVRPVPGDSVWFRHSAESNETLAIPVLRSGVSVVDWKCAWPDSAVGVLENQSAVQARLAPRICVLYRYWATAGVRQACPGQP